MGAGNKGKGGKAFRSGKGVTNAKRELVVKEEEGEYYARVRKHLGCGMLEVVLTDGTVYAAKVRGSMARNQKPTKDNTVLIQKRDFDDKKVDILHLYKDEEVKELVRSGEIPADFQTTEEREENKKHIEANEGYRFVTGNRGTEQVDETDAAIIQESGKVVEYDPLAGMDGGNANQNAPADEEEDADLDDI